MLRVLFLFFISIVFLISCKEDDSSTPISEEENFYALKVGNKWKYEYYKFDTNQVITDTVGIEEVEVISASQIEEVLFYDLKITTSNLGGCPVCNENEEITIRVRDSLGFLIEDNGKILFSNESMDPILESENEWGDVFIQLQPSSQTVVTTLGDFVCKNNERYAINPDGEQFEGRDAILYAEEVGKIKETYSGTINNVLLFEKVLVEFTLQ